MFSNLSKKLVSIIENIRKRGILTEEVVDATVREIRVSLLEADVALPVVKAFSAKLKEKLVGQKAISSITPEQTVIKAVYDELVNLLGESADLKLRSRRVMMLGLQGTGKTTTSAKLANLLKSRFKRNVLLVSLDTYRPAAIEQLRVLAKSSSIDFFDDLSVNDTPLDIARKAVKIQDTYDTVIYDTAGRLHIADDMMAEVSALKEVIEPDELLLVIDSMMGQDAINTAKAFNDLVQLTGLVLTRVDGDARGGAALSAKYVTNCQIKYMCTGEKVGDIEQFHPDRVASRILDKGDVLGLIEKAIDADIAGSIEDVATGKDFNLNGMAQYLRQLEKLGGFGGFLKFIPGMGRIKEQLNKANITDKTVARQLAIICSMTKTERTDPRILNASRRRRIAAGCAQEVSDVNRLIKQFEQIKAMMSKFKDAGVMRSLAGKFFK